MEAEWRKAIQRFLLNNLGQMDQDEVDAWLADEFEIAPLLEAPLKALSAYRDHILRELHQVSPPEILDRLQKEHPEIVFHDNNLAITKIGKELESLKAILLSF